jgi:hypothetical protein
MASILTHSMNLSNLLRFDYWLDPAVTAQPAGRAMWIAFAAALAASVMLGLLRRRTEQENRGLLAACAGAALVAAAVALGRIFQIPVLGWRIGWLAAGLIVVAAFVLRFAAVARVDGLVSTAIAALAFDAVAARPWRPATHALWWIGHLLGMAIVAVNIVTPLAPERIGLAAALSPLLLLLPTLPAWLARRPHAGVALAPFTYAYAVAILNFAGVRIDGPLNGLLYLPLALIVSFGFATAVGLRTALADRRFVAASAALLIAAAVGWSAWAALTLRTHGVTGSDPYAYTQMGVDLAERGTLAHEFPFVEQTYALGIDSHPVVHIGYRIPTDVRRIAPTVWPIGYPWFTAAAWLAAGETGVFLLTPLFHLIALALITLLILRAPGPRSHRIAIAALTVFLTATSYQQIEWQMIPMADIASQVFSLGALGAALFASNAHGARRITLAAISGAALGIAFDVRYTQVLIAPAIAFALALPPGRDGDKRAHTKFPKLDVAFWIAPAAALLFVIPTFVYHATWFGHPLTTGSEELNNFSLSRMPETLLRTLNEANWLREFGMVTPLIALGAAALWRASRRISAALALYFAPVFALHVFYDYLRLRDLLALFPVLYFLAAVGAIAAWILAERLRTRTARIMRVAVLFALAFVFVLRSMETLALPVTRGFSAFGYLVAEQRRSFDALATATESNAAIGCSLNSGAVDLHAGRRTFRPSAWTTDDAQRFIDALLSEQRPVYLLVDGEEMQRTVDALRARYTLEEVLRVDVPYYFVGSGSENRRVPLLKIKNAAATTDVGHP